MTFVYFALGLVMLEFIKSSVFAPAITTGETVLSSDPADGNSRAVASPTLPEEAPRAELDRLLLEKINESMRAQNIQTVLSERVDRAVDEIVSSEAFQLQLRNKVLEQLGVPSSSEGNPPPPDGNPPQPRLEKGGE